MYVHESTQILKVLDHHNLTLPAGAWDLIEKLYSVATDLRCRDTTPVPVSVPQFALVYGRSESRSPSREGSSRSASRNADNGGSASRQKNRPMVELTDSDPDLPLPAKKNGIISPESPYITKVSKRQLGELKTSVSYDPEMERNRSPSPDILVHELSTTAKSQSFSHKKSLRGSESGTTSPIPESAPIINPIEAEMVSPESPASLPDVRLPHLQKSKPHMPSITVPPSALSPSTSSSTVSQSPGPGPQQHIKPLLKNINTIMVSSVSSDYGSSSPKRRHTGRISTARRLANRENMLGKRGTLAAMQLHRTRSNVLMGFLIVWLDLI